MNILIKLWDGEDGDINREIESVLLLKKTFNVVTLSLGHIAPVSRAGYVEKDQRIRISESNLET